MVNFEKTNLPTDSEIRQDLAKEKAKRVKALAKNPDSKAGSYRLENVIVQVQNDFKDKCYICERKDLIDINIEHFTAHKGNPDLEFSWENLFWSCSHCNNIKSDNEVFNNILDCTNLAHKVAEWIGYFIEIPEQKGKIEIKTQDCSQEYLERVNNTVALLQEVYEGTTPLKKIGASNLRKLIAIEIGKLRLDLIKYYQMNEADELKHILFTSICKHLSISSPFTAFKRWLILQKEKLKQDFEPYFD